MAHPQPARISPKQGAVGHPSVLRNLDEAFDPALYEVGCQFNGLGVMRQSGGLGRVPLTGAVHLVPCGTTLRYRPRPACSANPKKQKIPPTVVKLQPPSTLPFFAVVVNHTCVNSPVDISRAKEARIRRLGMRFELGRGGSAWLGMMYASSSSSPSPFQSLIRNSETDSGFGITVPGGSRFLMVSMMSSTLDLR